MNDFEAGAVRITAVGECFTIFSADRVVGCYANAIVFNWILLALAVVSYANICTASLTAVTISLAVFSADGFVERDAEATFVVFGWIYFLAGSGVSDFDVVTGGGRAIWVGFAVYAALRVVLESGDTGFLLLYGGGDK